MRNKKKAYKVQNIKLAFVFCVFIIALIIGSLILKFGILIKKSRFDGQHRFTISLSKSLKNSDITVVSLAPDTKSISVLSVPQNSYLRNIHLQNISQYLQIPIDGFIQFEKIDKIDQKNIESNIRKIILNFNRLKTNLTLIDFLRIWLFTKNISSHAVTTKTVDSLEDEAARDKFFSFLFNDFTFTEENQSIQIINGTQRAGLGNRLSRLIGNMGGNVVSISTADNVVRHSEILYFGKYSYTVERLNKILSFTINKKEVRPSEAISDIIIIIGEDSKYD